MGFENRFEGNKGFAWIEPGADQAKYQFIIYQNEADASHNVPPEFAVAPVIFRNEEWIVDRDALEQSGG
ncbi:MAG: hypothetical protein RLZ28_178 [Actinomycetota bacterium]|jgi:hypothetical protein